MSSTGRLAAACCRLSAVLLFATPLFISASLFAADRAQPEVRVVEEIVAKVNGEIITRGELAARRQQIEEDLTQRGVTGAALAEATNKQAAEELGNQIDQLLLVQKGKELAVNVDSEVNRRLAEIQS